MKTFDDAVYVLKCNNHNTAIAATSYYPASASFIDVSDFERFVFLVHAGTLDSELTLQVRQDTSATVTASVKVVTGAAATVTTDDDDDVFIIEVETAKLDIANSFRYVSLYVTGAAGSNDYLDILFLGYNARHMPVTQPATTNVTTPVVG